MKSLSELSLADIMSHRVDVIAPDRPLGEAARLMAARHISSLVVTEGEKPVGILTERDLARLMLQGTPSDVPVAEVMSKPLHRAPPELGFRSAYSLLRRHGVRHLVVVDEPGNLVGLVSESDLRGRLGMDVLRRLGDLERFIERDIPVLSPRDNVVRALEFMLEESREFVLVLEEGRPLGILTERDLPRLLTDETDLTSVSLAEVMHSPLVTLTPAASFSEAVQLMGQDNIRHLPVVDDKGILIGILSQHRLLELLGIQMLDETLKEDAGLREAKSDLESRLELVMEVGGLGAWRYNHALDAMVWDQGFCRLLGGERDPDCKCSWLTLVHPEDLPGVTSAMETGRSQGRFRFTCRLRHADGRWIWVENRGRVVRFDSQNRPLYSLGAAIDITERKEAEAALRASETLHREVLSALGEGVYGVDEKGRCTFINPAALGMLGFREEEVLGQPQHALFHHSRPDGEPYPFEECPIHLTTLDGIVRRQEDWFIRKDGKGFPVELIAAPLTRDGERSGAVTAFQDISERKQAEERIRKLFQAVEQSPESIFITDLEGRILYVNEAFSANSGYRREDLIGRNPHILQSGKTPGETYRSLWEALRNGRGWKGEFINRRKDGSECVEFARISPIRQPDGKITHYLAIQEDISEKKRIGEELDRYRHHLEDLVELRTEELTLAKEAAENANRAKSAFLANMSHEIRTPMNAIAGNIHMLGRELKDPDHLCRLEKIRGSSGQLLAMVNDLLDISRIEAGRFELEQVEFSPSALLEQLKALTLHKLDGKSLEFRIEAEPLPPVLTGDRDHLRQALLNYLDNAVKFTERGGITLRLRIEAETKTSLLLRFEVEDTGIGVPVNDAPRLFEPFEQVDASFTRKQGGTGLGLAITKQIIDQHHGEILIESVIGQGTCVTVILPVDQEEL